MATIEGISWHDKREKLTNTNSAFVKLTVPLDQVKAQGETKIQPHGSRNSFGREAMALVAHRAVHPSRNTPSFISQS